jgi:hypothetical protein
VGSFRANLVPFPFSLSKVMSPPIAFASRLLAAKPKPWPSDLVVNSGWKMLGLTSSGMPSPVSSTVMMQSPSCFRAFMLYPLD